MTLWGERGQSRESFYRRGGKRLLDVVLVLTAVPVVVPLACSVAALVRLCLGTPVLYHQQRPGCGGKLFTMIKFRSMSASIGGDGRLLSDAARLGRFGRWLRATSLDELPELWNVLRGDMSLVGPRPLLVEYLPLYSRTQARRHAVRPGISGWAQVNGRNELGWEEKFAMDVWYVEHLSFGLDLRIIWKTLVSVVRRDGISATGEATMPRFTGRAM